MQYKCVVCVWDEGLYVWVSESCIGEWDGVLGLLGGGWVSDEWKLFSFVGQRTAVEKALGTKQALGAQDAALVLETTLLLYIWSLDPPLPLA